MSNSSDSAADWFDEWVEYHLLIFGLDASERAMKMMLGWRRVLMPLGYSLSELMHATEAVAGSNPPQFLNQHLPRIIERLQTQRALAIKRRDEKVREFAVQPCELCAGTGFVIVPLFRDIDRGMWVARIHPTLGVAMGRRTGTVYCVCMKGESFRIGASKGVGLAQYEMMNPKWREQLAADREEQAALNDARLAALQAEGVEIDANGILRRLAGEIGKEPEEGEGACVP